jgi:hypothetical protein
MSFKLCSTEGMEGFVERFTSAEHNDFTMIDLSFSKEADNKNERIESSANLEEVETKSAKQNRPLLANEDLMKLTERLLVFSHPFSLNLADLNLKDPIIEAIEPIILSQRCLLEELVLAGNSSLSLNFFKRLASAISVNKTIRLVDLSRTAAESEGKQLIVNSIILQGNVFELDLGSLPEQGIEYLIKRLDGLTFLKHLAFAEGSINSKKQPDEPDNKNSVLESYRTKLRQLCKPHIHQYRLHSQRQRVCVFSRKNLRENKKPAGREDRT